MAFFIICDYIVKPLLAELNEVNLEFTFSA
jgi:hypothetical protein